MREDVTVGVTVNTFAVTVTVGCSDKTSVEYDSVGSLSCDIVVKLGVSVLLCSSTDVIKLSWTIVTVAGSTVTVEAASVTVGCGR